jgi:hypothetical protein
LDFLSKLIKKRRRREEKNIHGRGISCNSAFNQNILALFNLSGDK